MSEKDYYVPVVWLGVVLGDASTEEFEGYFKNSLGFRVKYVEEFVMQGGDFNGLHCTIFNLHKDDVGKFALWRLRTTDMKWLDDWIENRGLSVPIHIIKKYGGESLYRELLENELGGCD